jgi:hypothetical protein
MLPSLEGVEARAGLRAGVGLPAGSGAASLSPFSPGVHTGLAALPSFSSHVAFFPLASATEPLFRRAFDSRPSVLLARLVTFKKLKVAY